MGETPHRSWDKESRATEGPEVLLKWEEASTENKPGGVRPGRVPRGPWPYTPPPQALESRGSGMRDSSSPCSPQAQEFHQQMGGGASDSVQVGSHWIGNCSSSLPPPKPLRLAPCPPLPLPALAWCVPGAGRKQTRRGGFAGSGVTLTQLQQSLMADTHSACSGGTVAVARKPAAA